MKTRPIIIAGGGIAGLAAALALHGEDEIRVFEKSPQFNEAGAGIQIGPNAVRALKSIGAWEAVSEITNSPAEIQVRDGRTGRIIQRIKLGGDFQKQFGEPYRVCHRADLHSALLQTVKTKFGISIELDSEVTAADGGDAVINGKVISGQSVIAADGVHSKIRQQMYPGSAARAINCTMFRSLTEGTSASDNVVALWLCPGGHLVHYPVGKDQRLNLVAVFDGTVTSPDEGFSRCYHEITDLMAKITNWSSWPVLHVPELPRWHDSATCLIGDAAHGTVPFLAQGAAMALEDAAVLLNTRGTWSERFHEYEQQRRSRTRKLDRQSRRMTRIYHMEGITAAARNTAMAIAPSKMALSQLAWIYRS